MAPQDEFLFADGPAPASHPPDPRSGLYAEVASVWQLPVGQTVRVDLTGHDLPHLRGRLELAAAPDLPLDRRRPLSLRIGGVDFSSRQIAAWAIA